MNELQAMGEGLEFTGIYYRDKQETKDRIAIARKEYPRTRIVLVTTPDSKYSMGPIGVGYSAYADKTYMAYNCKKKAEYHIGAHAARLQRLKEAYERQVDEAEGEHKYWQKVLAEANETIGAAK